jgi:hypothetical protein
LYAFFPPLDCKLIYFNTLSVLGVPKEVWFLIFRHVNPNSLAPTTLLLARTVCLSWKTYADNWLCQSYNKGRDFKWFPPTVVRIANQVQPITHLSVRSPSILLPELTSLTYLSIHQKADDLPSLSFLSNLRTINFREVQQNWTNFDKISEIRSLTTLKFPNAVVPGESQHAIFEQMENLETLTTTSNYTNEFPAPPKLATLHLDPMLQRSVLPRRRLISLKKLTTLRNLTVNPNWTDIDEISEFLTNLDTLHLSEPRRSVKQSSEVSLLKLTMLKSLQVTGCAGITDATLEPISENLETFRYNAGMITSITQAGISLLTNLTDLSLSSTTFSVDLRKFQSLQMLTLKTPYGSVTGISELKNLKRLKTWDDFDFSEIQELPNLTYLLILVKRSIDESMIAKLTNLQILKLLSHKKHIPINLTSATSGLTNLTSLKVTETSSLQDSGLSALQNLTDLYLGPCKITNAGILMLTNLTNIQLHGPQFTNKGVSKLVKLIRFKISDNKSVFDLGKLPNLVCFFNEG